MSELKPCPFCGKAAAEIHDHDYGGDSNYRVQCSDPLMCGARGSVNTRAKAYEKWNRRAEGVKRSPVEIESIRTTSLRPDDIIVIKTNKSLSREQHKQFALEAKKAFGNYRVVVLEPGISVGVVRHDDGEQADTPTK